MTEPTNEDLEDAPLPIPSYTVGYGCPPLHTRFQPGQSGNRRGRPKGARNLATELKAVLAETVVVREGERSRKVPKLRALVVALVNRGLKGDHRAAATLVTTLLRLDDVAVPAEESPAALAAEDARILERALGRAVTGTTPAAAPEANEE
jgi:hypothetical protein